MQLNSEEVNERKVLFSSNLQSSIAFHDSEIKAMHTHIFCDQMVKILYLNFPDERRTEQILSLNADTAVADAVSCTLLYVKSYIVERKR